MQQQLEWIESGGGPLLLAPRSALAQWQGTTPSAPGAVTDYERACAVTEEIDAIAVGAAQALVLGDEPNRTALIAQSPSSLLILRWRWATSEPSLLAALNLEEIGRLASTDERSFTALAEEYVLFDSAYGGTEITQSLRARLTGGTYAFDTVEFKPNAETCALIHRIRLK